MIKYFRLVIMFLLVCPCLCLAQDKPLRITITDGVVEPLPLAIPKFLSEIIAVKEVAKKISSLVSEDLTKTGLFRMCLGIVVIYSVLFSIGNLLYSNYLLSLILIILSIFSFWFIIKDFD